MKKLILALMLLTSIMMLFAQTQNYYNKLNLLQPYIEPQYAGFTRYDYMVGGYDGYAIRLQEADVPSTPSTPRAAYMTHMKVPLIGNYQTTRRQVRSIMSLEPDPDTGEAMVIADLDTPVGHGTNQEGFGSLAMDEETGTPIIVWHTMYGSAADGNPNIYITSEQNAVGGGNIFGYGFSAPYLLRENGDDEIEEFQYIWPIVHMGHSPIPGKKRIYVFARNTGPSHQPLESGPTSTNPAGMIPSSAEWFTYVDVDANFFTDGGVFDPDDEGNAELGIEIEWSEPQEIPYFKAIHDFNYFDFPELNGKYLAIRSAGSMNVAPLTAQDPYKGRVAYAGNNTTEFTQGLAWERDGIGEHEFYVVYNNNYGEAGQWQTIPFYLSSRERISTAGGWGHFYRDADISTSRTDYRFGPNAINDDMDNVRIQEWGLGHMNIIIGENGHINFPVVTAPFFTREGADPTDPDTDGYYYPQMASIYMGRVNPDTNPPEIFLFPIYPRPEPGLMYYPPDGEPTPVIFPFQGTPENPPHATVSWDQNNDGFFDLQFNGLYDDGYEDSNGNRRYADTPEIYPVNFPAPDETDGTYKFHANYIRMTGDTDGIIVAVWVDSGMAYLGQKYPGQGYDEWADVPELMFSASLDHGVNWTEPISINSNHYPNIFPSNRYPEYIYPADKVIRLSNDSFRVYLMGLVDYSYGTYTTMQSPYGQDIGGEIQYMALDFQVVPADASDTDTTIPKPEIKMLSQNYPNPFNPSTTIRFNLPNPGNVKLSVYNVKGQLVKTLIDGFMNRDMHEVVWNGDDDNNRSVASGVYFYRLEANGKQETKKMLLMK